MSRHIGKRANPRVSIAIGMLVAVLTLLGAHHALDRTSPAAAQPVEMASAMVTSPAH